MDHTDMSLLESGRIRNYFGLQSEAEKSVDPRIISLLGFFKELYYRRQEMFKKMFPAELYEESVELFKKFGYLLNEVKSNREVRTLQRSLSLGSPRARDDSELKLERFKVRTVNADGPVQQAGQGGQGDNNKTKGGASK
ncbi:Protease Do-like 4, mitochondrial [Quillaja saponaria]|uniref:Protease Do-like 4, mitochondrial n=1 Tax=Quillaja saponaria TaxID=32244 RepID=A0AAD7PX49_QUISA|nr:Protease Do-like 4, mitochondrial [Quillaja saponaria]